MRDRGSGSMENTLVGDTRGRGSDQVSWRDCGGRVAREHTVCSSGLHQVDAGCSRRREERAMTDREVLGVPAGWAALSLTEGKQEEEPDVMALGPPRPLRLLGRLALGSKGPGER